MAHLTIRCATVALLGVLLAACVSSSSKPPPPESKKEAAKYNMELGISYLRKGDYKGAQGKLEKAVKEDDSLATAALAMAEHATTHLLVVAGDGAEPLGILSALDVARALVDGGRD